jgi:hypothetical protein
MAELEIFKIVYPSGAPILPDLLRYQALAVNEYGCALDAPAERDFASSTCLSPRGRDLTTGKLGACKIQGVSSHVNRLEEEGQAHSA